MEEEKKAKKPVYKKWWFWVIIVLVVIIGVGGTGKKDNTKQTSSQGTQQNSANESNTANTDIENKGEGDIGKYHVAILDHSITKDYENKKILLVKISYTNNEDEAKAFGYTLNAKAFQNGIELNSPISSYGINGLDWQEKSKEVKKGITHEFNIGFYIEDINQDVEIEISPYISTKYSQKIVKVLKLTNN